MSTQDVKLREAHRLQSLHAHLLTPPHPHSSPRSSCQRSSTSSGLANVMCVVEHDALKQTHQTLPMTYSPSLTVVEQIRTKCAPSRRVDAQHHRSNIGCVGQMLEGSRQLGGVDDLRCVITYVWVASEQLESACCARRRLIEADRRGF